MGCGNNTFAEDLISYGLRRYVISRDRENNWNSNLFAIYTSLLISRSQREAITHLYLLLAESEIHPLLKDV